MISLYSGFYHDDFRTPGIWPFPACFLKQILHMANLLMKARGLPHNGQRLYRRTLNLGFSFTRLCFAIKLFLAILYYPLVRFIRHSNQRQ